MDNAFFQSFCSLHGKYPPCRLVFCVRVGRGGAIHMKLMVVVIRVMMLSNLVHATDRCVVVKVGF